MEESRVLWFLLLFFTVDKVMCWYWGIYFSCKSVQISRISSEIGE